MMKGLKRAKAVKAVLRVAKAYERILEGDVVGALNIVLKYLSTDGSLIAFGSRGAHGYEQG